jgi:hypothetical protein
MEGHSTHISVGLLEWAKSTNIVIFILPAHTSHLLQPLDVACFGPFERMYNNVCHRTLRLSPCYITSIIVSRNKAIRWLCSENTDNISVCRKYRSRFKTIDQILWTECFVVYLATDFTNCYIWLYSMGITSEFYGIHCCTFFRKVQNMLHLVAAIND